ncbi:MAG: gliding motility-associated C-terminal domain-containing protein [Bacteroidales bacterium]|nr:gliding motility-associated C-terminal domain-containing protein [Bacteroidales bacterium]
MRFVFLILFLGFFLNIQATHNRAGEITYEHIEGLRYRFTVLTYTYTPSLANAQRDQLEVMWGDGTVSYVERILRQEMEDDYDRNVYIGEHTFPEPGIYEIIMSDPNRNAGVENIPNSVNVIFTLKTTMMISSGLGPNSTPVLTNPPVDWAAVGKVFIHNPAAYDPDGDSLSYKLTPCLGDYGNAVSGYQYPEASNSLHVNPYNGDLIWNTPVEPGVFNIAMLIEEWRKGVKIGQIVRDMQIEVKETDNKVPFIGPLLDFCVEAGTLIEFPVTASDPDGGVVTLSAYGGPFLLDNSPAVFDTISGTGTVTDNFRWQTVCNHVRKNPYQVVFKVKDDGTCPTCPSSSLISLVDQKNVNITVVGPAPENLVLEPSSTSISLSWNQSSCSKAVGYYIYRKTSFFGFVPDSCETGVPSYTGYEFIDKVDSLSNTDYLDNNKGLGLPQGYDYCYMVTAFYPDGAESYASEEVCTKLIRGIPTITHVDVLETSSNLGKIFVQWAKPIEFDSLATGPYCYVLFRSEGFWGEDLQFVDTLYNWDSDTSFIDSMLNTENKPYSYKVEFWNINPDSTFLIGAPHIASSVFITFSPDDNNLTININKNVPWINDNYVIYKQNSLSFSFDSIGITPTLFYTDSGLINGNEYCYKVKSIGGYAIDGIIHPIINHSQESCGTPKDTVPSCPPVLQVNSICDSLRNELVWSNPNNFCSDDVIGYKIYYKSLLNGSFEYLASTNNANDTVFFHYPELSMAGCYVVTAIDSFNNESLFSNWVCTDECTYYVLPNVFTPNGDGINDLYQPGPYRFVEKVDMKIFNRWGILVYETDNPDINWDGRYMENGKMCTTGVYFYICDVYEYRLTGIEPRNLTGFIHVFAEDKPSNE